MPQPTQYQPSTSFLSFEAQQSWFPGHQLDAELANLDTTLTQILNNLELIQRDDGLLANESVGFDQLTAALLATINTLTANNAQAIFDALAAIHPAVTVDNTVPRFDGVGGKIQTSTVVIGDDGSITVQKNNSAAAITLTHPDATSVAFDTSPLGAIHIKTPPSQTTRNFVSGLWIETSGATVDKGRGILLNNYGASDGLYIQNDGASGTGQAILLQTGNTNGTGLVISTLLASQTGLIIRQETPINPTANGVLAQFTANGALTEMIQINSNLIGQSGIVFRFGGGSSPAISIKDGSENQLTQLTANGQAFFTGPLKFGTNFTSTVFGVIPRLQVNEANGTNAAIMMARFSADASGGSYYLLKSRHATVGSQTIIQNNDELGQLVWGGSDGTSFLPAGALGCYVDGTPGTNDMPTRMVFQLTADGAASYAPRMVLTTTALVPGTSDGLAFGSASLMISDLFLASGAVINFNNGNMTLTHAANQLTIAGPSNPVFAVTDGTVVQQFAPAGGAIGYVGTTSNHPLGIIVNNAEKWRFQADGVLLPLTNNAFDFGTTANRVRNGFYSGLITSTGATSGIGYATGAGGTVTQATSKATAVTLNTVTGVITMNSAALAAGTVVSFTLTDSAIAATDFIGVMHESGGTLGSYTVNARAVGAGTAAIDVRNNTAGSLSEAIVIRFVVVKSVNA